MLRTWSEIPVPVVVRPESSSDVIWKNLNKFNDFFPYPLVRPALFDDDTKVVIFHSGVMSKEDFIESVRKEYLRIFGEKRTKKAEKLNVFDIQTWERPKPFGSCAVVYMLDVNKTHIPKHIVSRSQPPASFIDISVSSSDPNFYACVLEEMAHVFFGTPDRNLFFYERSVFNRGYWGSGLVEYSWSDMLAMRIVLYAMKIGQVSRSEFKEVIWDYFLSRLLR